MDEPEAINPEAVLIYLDGARNALRGARHNLDGDFYGVAVNRVKPGRSTDYGRLAP
jgi:hypothetical protein